MNEYRFTANAIPKGQPRARATMFGNRARMWTPSTADVFKAAVGIAARECVPPEITPIRGAIELHWIAYLPRPQRLCRRGSDAGPVVCLAKPDRDNIDKAICDALQDAGVIADDRTIYLGSQAKYYAEIDGAPRAEICIRCTNTED
jgi:Holliday junction resolvase RusA-like endonuclease